MRLRKKLDIRKIEGQLNVSTRTQHMLAMGWNLKREEINILREKKKNVDTCDDATAIVLAHIVDNWSNMGAEPTRTIQLEQELGLNKGLKKFVKNCRD